MHSSYLDTLEGNLEASVTRGSLHANCIDGRLVAAAVLSALLRHHDVLDPVKGDRLRDFAPPALRESAAHGLDVHRALLEDNLVFCRLQLDAEGRGM